MFRKLRLSSTNLTLDEMVDKLHETNENPGMPSDIEILDSDARYTDENTLKLTSTYTGDIVFGEGVIMYLMEVYHLDTYTLDLSITFNKGTQYDDYTEKGIKLPQDYDEFEKTYIKVMERAFDNI